MLNFTIKFIKTILPVSAESQKNLRDVGIFDVDYIKVAEVISLLKSQELIKHYIDFIIFTKGSADEVRSFGLGMLYTLQAPLLIDAIKSYKSDEQDLVIEILAWGLANNFYPHINKNNYKKLIVGEHWALLDEKNEQREISKKIERQIEAIISYKN